MDDVGMETVDSRAGIAGESRRARLRRELTADILRIARQQLADDGPGGVTWRAIARQLGMNPASLYTYFDGRDALFTALILESYESLAAAVQKVADETVDEFPADHAMACAHAFREWANAHAGEFNLIFTDQIPGYAAPQDAGTLDAEMAVIRPLVRAVGRLTGREGDPAGKITEDADPFFGWWAMLHGFVALEINNHLPLDDRSSRFDRVLRENLRTLKK